MTTVYGIDPERIRNFVAAKKIGLRTDVFTLRTYTRPKAAEIDRNLEAVMAHVNANALTGTDSQTAAKACGLTGKSATRMLMRLVYERRIVLLVHGQKDGRRGRNLYGPNAKPSDGEKGSR